MLVYNPDNFVHDIKIFLGINTMMIKIKLSFWQSVTIISGSRYPINENFPDPILLFNNEILSRKIWEIIQM